MIDFDKMTVAEHEEYKEMQRKAEAFEHFIETLEKDIETVKRALSHYPPGSEKHAEYEMYLNILLTVRNTLMKGVE